MDDTEILETLKSSFMFNFRTGNVMIDTLVTGLVIMLSTYFLNMFNKLWRNLSLSAFFNKYANVKNQAKIVISGKKLQGDNGTRLEYSTNFFAVLYQIKKLDSVQSDIFELSEVPIQEPSDNRCDYDEYYTFSDFDFESEEISASDGKDKRKGLVTNLIVSQSESFKMTDDVFGLVNIRQDSDHSEKNTIKTEEFKITLYSETLSADDLRVILQGWVKEYEDRLNSENEKGLKYFLYTPSDNASNDRYDATTKYSEFNFQSGKSFSNIFYPEKENIVKRLDFFSNNKAWYKKRGIPYTMGFMFYGDPGCGKTSTIKAMANYTQRHIVSIPLNKIRTVKELLNLFYNVKMNHKDIPLHRRLYVLEDIDAADLQEIVGERSVKEKDANEDDYGINKEKVDSGIDLSLLNVLKGSSAMANKAIMGQKVVAKLTLASILEVLDGVMEMDGRMLIITTNYPEKLDKALIRPGRIDMKVHFGPMSSKNILEMYENYFENEVPSDFDTSMLPESKWTPAEVTQVFLSNMHNPNGSLRQLTNDSLPHNIEYKYG